MDAEVVLIGEAPGATEEDTGRPFQGRAGGILNRILRSVGLRREDVRVTNVVCCRPTDEEGRNRTPTPLEVAACTPYLLNELKFLNPKVVICLGETAAKVFMGNIAIGQCRGMLRYDGRLLVGATYHPASVFRMPELEEVIEEDIKGYLNEVQ
jgi:DNA polymerase